jgi:hypothetical protein
MDVEFFLKNDSSGGGIVSWDVLSCVYWQWNLETGTNRRAGSMRSQ